MYNYYTSLLNFEILESSREHQLDTIQLIDFTRSGIVIHRYDIRLRISILDLLDNALSDDMIRQARERLSANDVRYAGLDEFDHLAREEPAFSGLVSDLYDRPCVRSDSFYLFGRSKAL